MADYINIYKTPLLSAKALNKKVITGTISACYPETVTDQAGKSKDVLIIEIDDGEQRISLNKTNAVQLAEGFGRDYDEWVGKKVRIATKKTEFMGKACDGLDIKPIKK